MEKDNYILNIINDITEVLQKNDYTRERYANDVEWLNEKAGFVKKNIVRVAIMGITSSGKSTLVNTMLQEKLLPVAIKPSSSIIITCSRGKERQAVIYFNDKNPICLKGEELNEENIGMYCDESKNPENGLKVAQIDITTPVFMLDENINIIDSPGLDACGLEIHEKVTMEILLPTIDVCLFLTTVKANSDEINSEKMRIIHRRGKQIVLAQNMIDSVEEKIGKNGIVEESRIEILRKHKKRGENLLNSVVNDLKNENRIGYEECEDVSGKNFEVVQISALNALKGILEKNEKLYEESNFNEFIKSIKNCVSRVSPRITRQREISIISKIESIIKTDRKIIDESIGRQSVNNEGVTKKDIDDTFRNFKRLKDEVALKIESVDGILYECINDIKKEEDYDLNTYSKIIERINKENESIEEEILLTIKACEYKKNELYKKLNMDAIYSYALPSMNYENVQIMHKYQVKTEKIKKDGVLNKGKRLFSNVFDKTWGYEEKTKDEKIIDKGATIKKLESVCDVNRVKYVSILKEWTKQYTRSINLFYNEVSRREKDLMEKKNQGIDLTNIEDIFNELEKIRDMLVLRRKPTPEEIQEAALANDSVVINPLDNNESFKNVETHLKRNSYNMYKITNSICEKNYLLVGRYMNKEADNILKEKCLNLFWTWNEDAATRFIARMYGIYLSDNEIMELKDKGIYRYNNIVVVYENNINKISLYEKLRSIYGKKFNIYLIFNGIQIANSEKYILNNVNLREFTEYNHVIINPVIDSYKEFSTGKNIKELLFEVFHLQRKIMNKFEKAECGKVIINSKNPVYNMALIECQNQQSFVISTYKNIKEKIIGNLMARGKEEKEMLEEILSFFLENGKNMEDNHGR
ncbi:dynamin family protein [uncultured Clostridium sp.]|uniref:dynamin family protein n=1 Tax=uncultured Clostridium sp. TaxID=59620 RepID=UPI0025D1DA6C|nr:dynamin family protein [uncultured Clostridium sp.]